MMQFDARLTGDAATLARAHEEVLGRLPATVRAFVLVELQKWPALFAPEQRYQRALLAHLSRLPIPELQQAVAGIARVEAEAGAGRLTGGDPGRFQDDAQALLRTRRLLPAWRKEVDGFFQQVDPALEPELYPANAPRRLVVQIYGSGIADPGRQGLEPLQGDRRPRAADAGRRGGLRAFSARVVRRTRQRRDRAGAVDGGTRGGGSRPARRLDHRVPRGAARAVRDGTRRAPGRSPV